MNGRFLFPGGCRSVLLALAIFFFTPVCGSAQGPSLFVHPTSLGFNADSGDPTVLEQEFFLMGDGAVLGFTATATVTTPPGGAWLSVSPTIGVTPATLTVTVDPAGLPDGNYQGTITITNSVADNSPLLFPVSLGVGPIPGDTITFSLVASPVSFSFSHEINGTTTADPDPPEITVFCIGDCPPGGVDFAASVITQSGFEWLGVSPAEDTTPSTLTLSVDPTDLTEGNHFGIIFLDFGATALPQLAAVNLAVTPEPDAPQISLRPTELTFNVFVDKNPAPKSFDIVNAGNGKLNWTAAITSISGDNWLALSPTSGVGDTTVAVTVNSASLPVGTYSAIISVSSPGVANSPQTLTVSLTVAPKPTLVFNPFSLTFSGSPGSNPASQQLTISSSEGALFWSATVSTSSGGDWLSLFRSSPFPTAPATVAVNTAGLGPGTYQGTITISSPDAANSPQTVSVTLILGMPAIALIPASLVFITTVGQGPAPQTFEVENAGSGVLGWTATAALQSGGNWLSVSPLSGTASSTLTVEVNSAGLTEGTYTGTVTIAALDGSNATNSPQVLMVSLSVGAPVIGQDGVVNGASFSIDAVNSPGSIVSLFGVNLATTTALADQLPLPTTLGGTQVLVDEVPAPLFFVSPLQINFQIPPGVSGTTVQVVVVSNGVRGLTATVEVAPEIPGIFTTTQQGSGQGAVLLANTDVIAAPAGSIPGRMTQPVARGEIVSIFCTGLGPTDPPVEAGQPAGSSPPSQTLITPVVLVEGVPAEVLFSGLAPGFVGLYQVNVRIAAATPAGDAVTLQIQIGGQSSNMATIAVQ